MTDEQTVRKLYPDVELYAEWYFVMGDKEGNPIGGGSSPVEAWADAAQRIEAGKGSDGHSD